MRKISEGWQLRLGVILSYATEAVEILSGLIYTPIMLSLLGQSEYGLYQLVYSVVSYLSLIGLGFSSSYQRYYAKAKREGEPEVAKLNSMFAVVFGVMSAICLLCGAFMVLNAELVFGNKLTATELEKSRVLLGLAILSMSLTFPNSLFTSHITANRQFVFQRLVTLLQRLVNPFICVPLLLLGFGSVGLVTVSTTLTVIAFVSNIGFCLSRLKMKFIFKGLRFTKLKEIWGFTFFIFLNQIVNQVNWNVDKFLLGRYYGTAVVAVYSIGGQIRNYFSLFSTSVSNVFIPQVNEIASRTEENKEMDILFTKVGRMQAMILFLVFTGFLFFGKSFIYLWAGPGYNESYYIALMTMAVLLVPYMQNLGVEIQRAKNKHRIRSVAYAIMALLNIVISIPLIKRYGATGAAVGTVIAVLVCNVVFMNVYYACYIGLDIRSFWKEIMRLIAGLPVPIAAGVLINYVLQDDSWLVLLIKISAYTAVYVLSMYLFGNNSADRAQLKRLALGFLGRKRGKDK